MPPSSRNSTSFFRYTLRGLLLLTTVLAILLAMVVHRIRVQQRGLAAIRQAEGEVWYDYQYTPTGKRARLATPPGPQWLRSIMGDELFVSPVKINLQLTGEKTSDTTIEMISGLRELESLDLGQTGISDSSLRYLGRMPKLRELNIENTEISDEGLRHLIDAHSLEDIDLSGTAVTSRGLVAIAALPNLRNLAVVNTRVDDKAVGHLSMLSRLQVLALGGTQVSDLGLAQLHGLVTLRKLDVRNTAVSDESIQALQRALPQCTVRR